MTPERWAEVDKLLDEALSRSPEDRAAFLASACHGDETLLSEVRSLLAAHQKAEENFLDRPALDLAAQRLAQETRPSLIGQTLGHYSVISVLGVGGMGEVYLARDTKLDRKVALKLLPPQYTSDPDRIRRFGREARAASALNHPNIITIYEIGQIGNLHFIAAEHVDGQTLREMLSNGRFAESDAIEIAIQIASALSAAHEVGIVHRDIKPENVMRRRDGYVKVLDFGLVKLIEQNRSPDQTNASESDRGKTNPGTVLGTVRYMSPEQALGQEIDHRSDLFSLGVLLYEMITGVLPFKGGTPAATLDAIVHHHPLTVTEICKDLHQELERIVGRVLEKDRDLRYQTAGDLRSELKRLQRELDSSPSNSIGVAGVKTQTGRSGLNVHWPIAVVIIAVALAAAGLASWRALFRGAPEPSPWLNAYNNPVTGFSGEERNPSLSPDAKNVYYARRLDGQWDIFLQRIGGAKSQNLTEGFEEDDEQPACSPDGSSIVFRSTRNGGGLFVMGATGESPHKISDFGHNPSWSPDSKEIVCGTDYILDPKRRVSRSELWVINVASGEKRSLLGEGDAAQPRWSPNGHRIAYYFRGANGRRDIWTVPAKGGEPVPVTNDDSVDWNPVWSADGRYLYFASDRNRIASLWRAPIDELSGKTLGSPEAVSGPVAEILQIDLSRDGRRIVYSTRLQFANLRSVNFDPAKKKITGDHDWITQGSRPSGSPNVSPDGRIIAFHTLGATQEDILLIRGDGGGGQTNLTNDDYLDRSPRWSPDGNRLAFFSNRTGKNQVWLINSDGSGKRQMTFGERGATFPFWSPDGKRLAYNLSNNDGGTQITEVDEPLERQTHITLPPVNELGNWFNGWSWSPDGKLIAGTVAGWHGKEIYTQPGVFIYSMESRRYERITDLGNRPEWLNDSRHFIYINAGKENSGQIWLADTRTRRSQMIVSQPPFYITSAGISRDNRRIFYTATDHQADIYLLSLDK